MTFRPTALVLATVLLCPFPALAEGARYLIIAPDSYVTYLDPLVEWKNRKGMPTTVLPLSQVGYSSVEIRNTIVDAVNTWDPAPEYVLLVGDQSQLPMANLQGGYTDTYYGDTDNDTFIEIHPARFPAQTSTQVQVMVEKTLNYERYPTTDPSYYLDAVLTIAEDWDDDDWVHYYGDANWEAGLMHDAGFETVDIYTKGTTPDPTGTLTSFLNDGASYAAFHGQISGTVGWWGFDVVPDNMHNGPMLPIAVSYTCQTVAGASYGGEEWVRAGSPGDVRGAVAHVGQSISCSGCAHWRSSLRRGFWGHIFEDTSETDIVTMAAAVEAGRLHYYQEILSTQQYVASNMYGDPELNLWTAVPREIDVSHPPCVPGEAQTLTLSASMAGEAREGVRICLYGDGGTHVYGLTDETGSITFDVDTTGDEVLHITATGRNLRPYEAEIDVVPQHASTDDDDDATGDDDDTTGDDDDITGDDDDITGDGDDDVDDDDDTIFNNPDNTVEIGSGSCECRQSDAARPPGALLLLTLAAALGRRRWL